MDSESELDDIAKHERFSEGMNGKLMEYRYEAIEPYLSGERCLELGCADGLMTGALVNDFNQVVAVDGSAEYCELTRGSVCADNLTVVHSMFEEYDPGETFDTVVACHILEHVDDPRALLTHIRSLLADEGQLVIDVPNAGSIHRRVGVEMGLLDRIDELNERDRHIGHQRVYRRDQFHSELRTAGFDIDYSGGVFLKPLANGQIDDWFTEKMLDGFAAVGRDLPELAAEIYCVCSK